MKNLHKIGLGIFLVLELIAYILIFTASSMVVAYAMWGSIILAFVYTLTLCKRYKNEWIVLALFTTIFADYFLIVVNPRQQAIAMTFFLMTQINYAVWILMEEKDLRHRISHAIIHATISVLAVVITCIVLQDKVDYLSVISVVYFANLIINFILSCVHFRYNWIFSIGLLLFLCCDIVVGLNCAIGVYIDIASTSILYKIAFAPFNLAWVFYLPSQVLIACSSLQHKRKTKDTHAKYLQS